jgi:predicted nucleotidyltransferase
MDLNNAFQTLQQTADADPDQVDEARARRDLFRKAFEPEGDVVEVIPSGSLARSTQREPINDVDVIIVFEAEEHADWGQDGSSAADALSHLQDRVKELLGTNGGSVEQVVRRVDRKNHAVKCFLDDPGDPDAFTVDAMPALRQPTGELLVPERLNETWIRTDPEHLIKRVADRQADWNLFRAVRVLKYWNETAKAGMKSLTVEVLALDHLPEGPAKRASQPDAYRRVRARPYVQEQPASSEPPTVSDAQRRSAGLLVEQTLM